jgi:hypothetical protein
MDSTPCVVQVYVAHRAMTADGVGLSSEYSHFFSICIKEGSVRRNEQILLLHRDVNKRDASSDETAGLRAK